VQSLATVAGPDGAVFADALHEDLTFRCWELITRKLVSEVPKSLSHLLTYPAILTSVKTGKR